MKALSVKQPWAELIASGVKTIETRTWYTSYRGPLLICSSKRPVVSNGLFQCPECLNFESFKKVGASSKEAAYCHCCGKWVFPRLINCSPSGVAVCTVNLIACRPMDRYDKWMACCGLYQGAFSWVLSDVKRITPFPVKGQQGLFDVTVLHEGEIDNGKA